MILEGSKYPTMSHFYSRTTISELSVVFLKGRRLREKVELVYVVSMAPIC